MQAQYQQVHRTFEEQAKQAKDMQERVNQAEQLQIQTDKTIAAFSNSTMPARVEELEKAREETLLQIKQMQKSSSVDQQHLQELQQQLKDQENDIMRLDEAEQSLDEAWKLIKEL